MATVNSRPTKACHDCKLNLGARCAIYDDPKSKWHHGHCPGYNNAKLIEEYERQLHPTGAKLRHVLRAKMAKLAHTVPHLDGRHKLK